MPHLKAEPAGTVKSLDEFFALAHAIETDALARYTETAKQLRQQGADALAAVFDHLAEVERGHVGQVTDWAGHRGAAHPANSRLPWTIPDTFDAPPGEMAQSKLLTPYRALASAVRHEERAFAFWTYVSAHAGRADVKQAAERMALEESEHVSILRRERRKAFHSERQTSTPAKPVTLSSLASFERRLAGSSSSSCGSVRERIASTIVADARRAADMLGKIPAHDSPVLSLFKHPSRRARRSDSEISEYLADAYLRFAEALKNPRHARHRAGSGRNRCLPPSDTLGSTNDIENR